jgi:Flp pilus assembly protein CpaB
MVVGVIMALVAGATAFMMGNQGKVAAEPESVPTRQILVATTTIPARSIIDSTQLLLREVPDDPSLASAISDPGQIMGLVTAVTIYADQPITPNLFATTEAGQEFSILGPSETISPFSPAWRAVSLTIPMERAVGGLVSPGQHVDIIASVPIAIKIEDENGQMVEGTTLDGYYSDASTKITLADVEVLTKVPETNVFVLKVDLHQAEELAALSTAQFDLALRPPSDNRVVDRTGYGETLNRVIEQYGYALPRVIQVDRYPQPQEEVVPEGSPTVAWPDPEPVPSIEPGASPAPDVPVAEPSPAPSPTPGS